MEQRNQLVTQAFLDCGDPSALLVSESFAFGEAMTQSGVTVTSSAYQSADKAARFISRLLQVGFFLRLD